MCVQKCIITNSTNHVIRLTAVAAERYTHTHLHTHTQKLKEIELNATRNPGRDHFPISPYHFASNRTPFNNTNTVTLYVCVATAWTTATIVHASKCICAQIRMQRRTSQGLFGYAGPKCGHHDDDSLLHDGRIGPSITKMISNHTSYFNNERRLADAFQSAVKL